MDGKGAPIAQKGGQKKSIALDQTGYGAIRRVDWGPLNRTFPAPYPPGSALSVENPCCGPWAQVPPSGPKKKWRNGAKPEPATGMPGGGCPRGPGNRGGHGPSRIDDGFCCAALNLHLRPACGPLRPTATHTKVLSVCPGAFPELTAHIDPALDAGVHLSSEILAGNRLKHTHTRSIGITEPAQ